MFNSKAYNFDFDFESSKLEKQFLECAGLLRKNQITKVVEIFNLTDTDENDIRFLLSEDFMLNLPWFLSNSDENNISNLCFSAALYLVNQEFRPLIHKYLSYLDPNAEELLMSIRPLLNYMANYFNLNDITSDAEPFISYKCDDSHSTYCESLNNLVIPVGMAKIPPFQECSKGMHCNTIISFYDLSKKA